MIPRPFCASSPDDREERWPIDEKTGKPFQKVQPGYYPGYSTLSQQNFWDAATRKVVLDRVNQTHSIQFFTPQEAFLLQSVCDRILPQDDRPPDRRIPIVPVIDQRLHENKIEGYRYEDMPSDRDAHRLGLQAIEEMSRTIHGVSFTDLPPLKQDFLLKSIHDGHPLAAEELWAKMNISRYWQLLVGDCVTAYYAHPNAWDEIGYGGPAYPRAYMRLEGGLPEPWEKDENRYEWRAPLTSISDRYEQMGGGEEHQAPSGAGGTH